MSLIGRTMWCHSLSLCTSQCKSKYVWNKNICLNDFYSLDLKHQKTYPLTSLVRFFDALQLVSKSFVRIFHGITFIRKFHHRIKTLRHIYTKSTCEIGNRSTSGGSTLYLTLSVIPWTATSTGPAAIITNVIFQFSTKLTRNPDNILDKLWIM